MATVGLALTSTVSHAEHWTSTPEGYAKQLSNVGAWQFSSNKKGADGKPECIEVWTFAKDGKGTLVSGEQVITLTWKYVKEEVRGMLLRITYTSSTAGKDCMQRDTDPSRYPQDNGNGFALLFRNADDSALVCNAPQIIRSKGREPIAYQSGDSCWGVLRPAEKA